LQGILVYLTNELWSAMQWVQHLSELTFIYSYYWLQKLRNLTVQDRQALSVW